MGNMEVENENINSAGVEVEELLIARTQEAIKGDREAFEQIYSAKRRELYLSAIRLLGSPEDAEDAVQETLLNMYQCIHTLKHPKALNAWLHRILYQRCVDIMRKRKRTVTSIMADEGIAESVEEENGEYLPERHAEIEEAKEELYGAIESLPEKSKQAFILYYLNDMKYSEIAEATNTSIKTVSTNLIRAKQKLRVYLAVAEAGIKSAAISKVPLAAQGIAAKVGIGAAGVLCAAGVTWYALPESPAVPPVPEPADFQIALESEDCLCGHINPRHAELKGIREGDTVSEWDVIGREGQTLFSGSLAKATEYITKLGQEAKDGGYRLKCTITDKSGYTYNVSRDILVGDYTAKVGDRLTP
jgi:RNA polymerase sigma-70 factor (ECF subfamily)